MNVRQRAIHGQTVAGLGVDHETRCAHYHSNSDVIAIRLACCDTFYSCISCHNLLAGHQPEVWPKQSFGSEAVLCGACGEKMSIERYLTSNDACPKCNHPFNPGCRLHRHLYFEVDKEERPPEGGR